MRVPHTNTSSFWWKKDFVITQTMAIEIWLVFYLFINGPFEKHTYMYGKKIIFNCLTFIILVTNRFKGHLISLTKIITLAKTLFILSPWNILLLTGHALILSEGPINYLMIFKIIYRKPKKFHVVFYEWTGRDLLLTVMNIVQVLMWIPFQFCGLFP